MTAYRLNMVLAAIFLIVGILATANTIRLNSYIRDTLPRDASQERCNTETIDVLKQWVQARVLRDAAMDRRDDAATVVLDSRLNGLEPTPEQIRAWHDAVINDRQVRATAGKQLVPLPNC
jgi:hypothetical protein